MKKVIFDYSIQLNIVKIENQTHDISELSLSGLKNLGKGKMFIFFEPQREYILLETGIIDYLIQLNGVIKEIDSGNFSPFSVSSDWYSNSLDYFYDEKLETLRINEVNGGEFIISTKYNKFKESFIKFYKKTIGELLLLYPELKENKAFIKSVIGLASARL